MTPAELMKMMADKKAAMKKVDKTAKLEPGDNKIRLLPSWSKTNAQWWHDFGQHFVKDAGDNIKAVYICTNATFEKDCPVCNVLSEAASAGGDDALAETLAKSKASRSVLIPALMLDSKTPNTPVILEIKRGLFEQILDIVIEYDGAPLDPVEGMIIKCTREGKGLNTKYAAMPLAKKYPVGPEILEKIPNIDEYVKQESDEQERRAVGAVNSIAGIGGGDRPQTSPTRIAGPASGPADLDDDAPAAPPPKKGAAATPPPALDADLDDMLADLPD